MNEAPEIQNMVCGVDCHPGGDACNGYCRGDVDRPPTRLCPSISSLDRPTTPNADKWGVWLSEFEPSVPYLSVQIAEAMEEFATRQRDEAVGAAYEVAADVLLTCPPKEFGDHRDYRKAIRALTPSDATAALEARDARVWDAAIEAAVRKHEELWRETDAYKRDQIDALKKETPNAD